jgi:hypothetical protein
MKPQTALGVNFIVDLTSDQLIARLAIGEAMFRSFCRHQP